MNSDNYTFLIIAIVIAILIMIITTSRDILEIMIDSKSNHNSNGWVRLYENWDQTSNPPETRKWIFDESQEFPGGSLQNHSFKKILNINLKSYDIAVPRDGHVILWAIYPDSNLVGQSMGLYSAYTDPYRESNPAKYRKIVEIREGQRIRGSVDFPVKRVLVEAVFRTVYD